MTFTYKTVVVAAYKSNMSFADEDISPQPGTSTEPLGSSIDWVKCVLCQADTGSRLVDPSRCTSRDNKPSEAYETIAHYIDAFHSLNELPFNINFEAIDDGSGVANTLKVNNAVWHKTCRNKIDKQKLERAQKRMASDTGDKSSKRLKIETRRNSESMSQNQSNGRTCIFCDRPGEASNKLAGATTFGVDYNVRMAATDLGDTKLLAKLGGGDMVAIDADYHNKCYVGYCKRAKRSITSDSSNNTEKVLGGIAFAELVDYIESQRDSNKVFYTSELCKMYSTRLCELGVDSKEIHTTRLRNQLLAAIPDLKECTKGKNVLLAFDHVISDAVMKTCTLDFNYEGLILARAANIIRRDVLATQNNFKGSFPNNAQKQSVPASLLSLVGMLLEGPSIKEHTGDNSEEPTASVSIAQLIVFNTVKRRSNQSNSIRHNRNRETPLPIYIALKVHAETRKRGLIDCLNNLGLCISYDRVMSISTDVANTVCARFFTDGLVCPPQALSGVFTTAAVDNIDHNPSSTSAHGSFHGTAISLLQHPTNECRGIQRPATVIDENIQGRRSLSPLPAEYTAVNPIVLPTPDPMVPTTEHPLQLAVQPVPQQVQSSQDKWLDDMKAAFAKPELSDHDFISWPAYYSCTQQEHFDPVTPSFLLPLFPDVAHSAAMIYHAMNVVKAVVAHLHPGQVPVIVADQPLYSLAKKIQWNFPATHGEDKYVVFLGGMHVELTAYKCLGNWLEGSGWTTAVTNSGIASGGTADSFLKASHLGRTKHAHQLTAAALYILMDQAYVAYKSSTLDDEVVDFTIWKDKLSGEQPQFAYWSKVLELELSVLNFVKAIRSGNFKDYIQSIRQLIPWIFALDHMNYARSLTIHLRDMDCLASKHPNVHEHFSAGRFVAHKTQRSFSGMALDQAHEQLNALVKGDGGAVGLTEHPAALRRWMVAGPEISRMIQEFECNSIHSLTSHHDQSHNSQVTFKKDVEALVDAFCDLGNPFLEDSGDLMTLDTKDIMDEEVVKSIRNAQNIGQEQYTLFVQERLHNQKKNISDPIKKNKLLLFSKKKTQSRMDPQVVALKEDRSLFGRLYVASQTREGDLSNFFKHENQPWPPSLSKYGEMRVGTKSDLLQCLEALCPKPQYTPCVDVAVLDGAAVVQMLGPGTCTKFSEYVEAVFMPYIMRKLGAVQRLDVVWDIYKNDSLKSATRQNRGSGLRRRVGLHTAMPGNWQSFLRVNENKTELFSLLAEQLVLARVAGKEVYSTIHERVLSSPIRDDMRGLAPCTHEEADSRIFVHVADAARRGHRSVMVHTCDTDVLAIAVSLVHELLGINELWLAFGSGKHFRYIAAHEIAVQLGPEKSRALPMFHALTGCDTVSSFSGKGKKTAWNAWNAFPEVTDTFTSLSQGPAEVTEDAMAWIEKFVIRMYDTTCSINNINETRQYMYCQKSRDIENIPPTQAALQQHALRAVYQAGYVWGQALLPSPDFPDPSLWGWKHEDGVWKPVWTLLPLVISTCSELTRCNCKKACRTPCKCATAGLECSALCFCGGLCFKD